MIYKVPLKEKKGQTAATAIKRLKKMDGGDKFGDENQLSLKIWGGPVS